MALTHSPKIVTDGLVFAYDMGNPQKSWRGAPTTNLYADGDFSSQTLHPVRTSAWSIVDDPRNGTNKVVKALPSAGNQYHGRDIPAVVSSVYSLQMEIYVSPDFNGTNVQMYPEQGGAGASRSYNLSNKGTWQSLRFDGKAATTTNIRMLAYVLSSFTTGYVLISKVQVEQNAFATPFVNGTRSNTQAVVDLTNNNTVTAASLTYASDGTFSFNGSNTYMSVPAPFTSNAPYTVYQWVKPAVALTDTLVTNGTGRKTPLVGPGPQWTPGYWLTARTFRVHAFTEYRDITINWVGDTGWHQIGQIFDGTTCYHILDGEIILGTRTAYSPGSLSSILIGAETTSGSAVNWNGNIGITAMYNRALTASEVAQNFNALRGRFGV